MPSHPAKWYIYCSALFLSSLETLIGYAPCVTPSARAHTHIVLIYAFVDSFVFQIIVPVLVVHVWCAYMFDMHRAEVHVLDPAYDSARFQAHQDIYKILLGAFHNCLVSFYEGWLLHPVETWKLMYPLLILDGIDRYV